MQEQERNQIEREENAESAVSMRDFFAACGQNWYWFVLSLFACVSLALVFAKSQTQRYSSSAYILIKTDKKSGVSGEMQLFSDLGLGNKANAVENEIYVIKSTNLMDQVVEKLGLACQYYSKPLLRYVNIYNDTPIALIPSGEVAKRGYMVEVLPVSGSEYRYMVPGSDDESWKTAKYGQTVTFTFTDDNPKTPDNYSFSISKTAKFNTGSVGEKVIVRVRNAHQLSLALSEKLEVKKPDKETSVLCLTLEGENFSMIKDILNSLIAAYNQDVINDKNRVALSTETFIVDRIAALSSDLGGIDTQIESLKIRNNIPDIQSAAGVLVTDGTRYKDAVAEVEMQLMLANYIKDYMSKMKSHELIPANTGIADMGVEKQIGDYNEECLRYEKIAASSGTANPVVAEIDKALTAMQNNINSSVDSYLRTLQIKLQQAQVQERKSNRLITSVPTQEKELNHVIRQQKIKEELYLYLLNKREENALQLAITEPNAKIIENAGGDDLPVFPKTINILIIGFLLGVLIPAGIIYLIFWIYSLDTKIHTRKDVENITDIPIVGELPCKKKEQQDQEIIVTETGKDRISEALRIIRGNIEYMVKSKDGEGIVIQMTSTVPHEGKSFVSVNLALSFAHAGKRVIAIDLDLRKGNFSKYLGGRKRNMGVGAYLSGRIEGLDEVITKGTIHKNLDTISVGALPPNPSDLLMSERFEQMIAELRRRYDIIFLDTVPYTVIADASIVQRVADITLYVIRDGIIDKRYIYDLDRMYRNKTFKNLAILLNDIKVDSKRYGYGTYGYGYGYGYGGGNYGYGYVEGEGKKKKKRFLFF